MSCILLLLSAKVVAQGADQYSLNGVGDLEEAHVGGVSAVNRANVLVGASENALTVYVPHVFITIFTGEAVSIDNDVAAENALVGVVIEYGTVKIGERAFKDCKKLGYVSISDTVASIGEGAFNGCAALTDVFYGLGESDFSKIEIGALNSYFENAKRHYNYVP